MLRLLSAVVVAVLCTSVVLTTSLNDSPQIQDEAAIDEPLDATPSPAGLCNLASHAPISISSYFGDSNESTGITRGSGTAEDPYVIQGWEIDATDCYSAISVNHTSAFFEIVDCYLYGALHSGIHLSDVTNGALIGNICSDNYIGISIELSSGNVVMANNCSGNDECGIHLNLSSNNNVVSNNNCLQNRFGIGLFYSCCGNLLSNNTCAYSSSDGMYLRSGSNRNTLSENICSSNLLNGIRIRGYDHNNTMSNNNCSDNNCDGIYLYYCPDSLLSGNDCWNNGDYGITIHLTDNVTVLDNVCSGNDHGIELWRTSGSTFSNNTCSYNYRGINGYLVSGSVFDSNNCSDNRAYGMEIDYTSDMTFTSNRCLGNSYAYLESGYNGFWGMYITSSNGAFLNNNCSNGYCNGMYVGFLSGTVSGNSCINNAANGMHVEVSDSEVSNNKCIGNGGYGLRVLGSQSDFHNNICKDNDGYGIFVDYVNPIYLETPDRNRFWNNTLISNNGAGTLYDPAHAQAYDVGVDNQWNSTDGFGNYWSDWTSPDIDMDGVVDEPYCIKGGAGSRDWYPLTSTPPAPIPEFGSVLVPVLSLLLVVALAAWRRRGRER